jgi:outer membrane protein OmpA-like peptidoglycan-associated protein
MKKLIVAFGVICTAILFIVTGCTSSGSNETTEEIHLAVVLGNHRNAPKTNLALIESFVQEACLSYGSVTLVCDDGAPYTTVIDIPVQQEKLSESKYQSIANDETKQILEAAATMQAKTDEVDTLKAIQLASRALSSVESKTGGKVVEKLVIMDSCLSTTGLVNFSKNKLTDISEKEIVKQLEELNEIPNLSNVEVTVYTCGDTAGEQAELTTSNRENLRNVWKAILEAGGAKVNMKNDLPLSVEYTDELPSVTPVTVVQNSVEITTSKEVEDVFQGGAVLSFDEKTIRFEEGSAELADVTAATKALDYVIEYMNSHEDFELLISGTTACWGGEEYCLKLSKQRAEVICSLIEKQGIDKKRITTVGLGYSYDEFYTYDQTPEGNLDETLAPQNRSVKLMNLNSKIAVDILSKQ